MFLVVIFEVYFLCALILTVSSYLLSVHLKILSVIVCEPRGMQVGNNPAELLLSHSWRQHHGSLQQQKVLH